MDTVLILHTHPIYRSGVKLLLLYEMDINVLEAGSGQEALDLLQKSVVDLVIIDSALPDMNGSDVMQWLATTRPDLPVLVLTSSTDIDKQMQRSDAIIPPTFTRQAFTSIVRTILQLEKID